ncbi:TetR/AcrR family transcriptional regulator [Salipaludibacillus agaradhaerens]|uniref:TetR/AcrR family transcriptional regulator n=1 Tax=Salipaludibacillus agaradhaerens TaxID=76935 RepID=UPI00215156B5|nr:TetR/AcrR family transcriptional regulator [Salipaludibacillus agaradhaerens]MCR6107526.1 TetR/AcrR family transcriptional regulator [Salipaludibacillus agaradhaerens]MCR6119555.1 TetR/AcrR family transcriptional regulator [Salipaludibacillus agaradhaerens]UJW58576.1 TetR/AcrR family transcriptional regulator [Bacillus sp. A116_S68]
MGKKRGQKYEQIIDAAVKVIAKNGYHQSQVSKIAKEAGVADGTIYLYFKNKEDILISLFEEKMGKFVERIKEKMEAETSVEKKLLILIEMHFMQLEMDHDLAIVTQLELRQSNIDIRYKINEVLKGYLTLIDSVIEEGIEKGVFGSNLDLRVTRQLIFGAMDEVVTNWVMKECKYELITLAEPIHRLLLNGMTENT